MSLSAEYERVMALRKAATEAVLRAAQAECGVTSMGSMLRAMAEKERAEQVWNEYADAAVVIGVIDNTPMKVTR